MRLLINFPAEAKICLMIIKYIDMVIPALQVEFKQVALITFQIIVKTIPIIKFHFVFKKMIIYILGLKPNAFWLLLTLKVYLKFLDFLGIFLQCLL